MYFIHHTYRHTHTFTASKLQYLYSIFIEGKWYVYKLSFPMKETDRINVIFVSIYDPTYPSLPYSTLRIHFTNNIQYKRHTSKCYIELQKQNSCMTLLINLYAQARYDNIYIYLCLHLYLPTYTRVGWISVWFAYPLHKRKKAKIIVARTNWTDYNVDTITRNVQRKHIEYENYIEARCCCYYSNNNLRSMATNRIRIHWHASAYTLW